MEANEQTVSLFHLDQEHAMNTEPKSVSPLAATLTPPNSHVLWRQLLGLVAWVGIPLFLCGGPAALVLGLLLGGLTLRRRLDLGHLQAPGQEIILE